MSKAKLSKSPIEIQALKGKYVVYSFGPDNKKFSWGLVTGESDTDITGINEKNIPYDDENSFDVNRKDIVAVLGKKPVVGSAYGCKIEPYIRTVESEKWGSLHFFTKLSPEDKELLKAGLSAVHKKLQANGLTSILPLDIEIRTPKGKYAGKYHWFSNPDKLDRMLLHPKDWSNSRYLIGHESGHGVWFNLLSKKAQARWIVLYHSYLTVSDCDASTVKGLKEDFTNQSEELVKDFRGQLDEEVAPVFDLCIDHITSHHGVSVANIDSLVEAEQGALLRTMWPTSKLLKTDYEYPISEYAMTKPEEFFAEAFGFWISGLKLPKKIQSLLESTLQRVAGKK